MKEAILVVLGVLLIEISFFRGLQAQSPPPCQRVAEFSVSPGAVNGTLVATWTGAAAADFSGYQLNFRPSSQSQFEAPAVELGGDVTTHTMSGLLNFTQYAVSVAPVCSIGGNGPALLEFATTSPTVPSGPPSNYTRLTLPDNLVRFSWPPLPEQLWNGVPLGYLVYLHRSPGRQEGLVHRVPYPESSLVTVLRPGLYAIEIAAQNPEGRSNFLVEEFRVEGEGGGSFVEYPYFYILIPGVLFLVITLAIIIVICKKLRERSKGHASFARELDAASSTYSKGFGNVIPLRDFSPHSPNTSASLPVSTVTSPSFSVQQQHHIHHLANRPLPLSPDLTLQPSLAGEDGFVATLTSQPSMARKLTHPGPLPRLEENVEQTGFVSLSRTMTDPNIGSVFSPTGSAPPARISSAPPPHHVQHGQPHGQQQQQHMQQQQQQQQHMQQQQQHMQQQQQGQQRGRSNTLPSPYEVPDSNPPPDFPPVNPQRMNRVGSNVIPPPPAHSPPPLTHSSTDLPHVFEDSHHPHTASGQNTLPRTAPNQRSFSTSAAQGHSAGARGVPYIKSDGNIHDTLGGEEEVGFYMPPVDSDEEPSLASSGAHSAWSETGRHQSLDRGRHPPYFHPKHQQPRQQQPRHPGMMNGALASSDQLGNFGAPEEGLIPPSYQLPPSSGGREKKRESMFSETSTELSIGSNHGDVGHRGNVGHRGDLVQPEDRNRRDSLFSESSGEISASGNPAPLGGRERARDGSVFSETSTELSVSSNNSKRNSPGWGGVKSDVGVSHRRQRSKSPPERETFSDVGAPRGVIVHPQQNGFV